MENKYNIDGILKHFKAISSVPRGSGNESAVSGMVLDIASGNGCYAVRDGKNNVFVRLNASHGMENTPSVLLQSHLDMVCEKDQGVSHDFLSEPIIPVFDEDVIRANGTTLGADDGIGVSMMLELITDGNIPHGPLELLFTTSEETGLGGMKSFDKSIILSRSMINLDSEEDTSAVISCAGGVRSDITFPFERAVSLCDTVKIQIGGFAGGHSGSDIHLGRCGAVRSMAQILSMIDIPFEIMSVNGGGKDNAIPRSCSVDIATDDADSLIEEILKVGEEFKQSLTPDDKNFHISAEVSGRSLQTAHMQKEQSAAFIRLVMSLPSGVISYTDIDPSLPETSANIASVRTDDDIIRLVVSSRSSVEGSLDSMEMHISNVSACHGATVRHRDRYPGWERTKNSPLQKKYLEAYERTFGEKASLTCIHAGLECGLIKADIPDMDIISIGPNMVNVHTSSEWVSISSIEKVWRLLCAVLCEM